MINIHVIGLGGTGSWFMNLMTRDRKMINNSFDLFDFDIIESKNVSRQDFSNKQIGLFKVQGVAYVGNKYDQFATEFKIARHPTKYSPNNVPDLVVSCIDTIKGRNEIFKKILKISKVSGKRIVLLDSGNEDSYGQVMINIIEPDVVRTTKQYIALLNRPQSEVRGNGNVSCVDFEEQTATINFHQAATLQYIIQNINLNVVNPNVIFTGSFLNATADIVVNKHATILSKLNKREK